MDPVSWKKSSEKKNAGFSIPHRIHVWYIYLHLVDFYGFHVGKYTIFPWIRHGILQVSLTVLSSDFPRSSPKPMELEANSKKGMVNDLVTVDGQNPAPPGMYKTL